MRVFFVAQEILVDLLELPDQAHRQELARLPPARPRLRQPRHAADAARHPLRLATRAARIAGALTAILCGHAYRVSAPRWRRPRAPFAGFAKNREPMLRVMGMHRDAAYAHRPRPVPGGPVARRCGGLGRRGALGRGARLPQRAGHRARADRHHRPADGLRHDRHRARLRAREVQEARRRRLLQDRQPVGARGAQAPRLRRGAGAGDRRVRLAAPTRCSARRTSTARRSRQRGLTDEELAKVESALPGVFDLEPGVRAVGPRRRDLRAPRRDAGAHQPSPASPCSSTSASPRRDRRGERRRSSVA